jgi:ATP-dependent Lhr-like helicase
VAHDGRANAAGRWSLVQIHAAAASRDAAVEAQAWSHLRRYGVVFRRLLTREANAAPWRELTRVYRQLEARGHVRGGRFVAGMSGEQFALDEAVTRLREVRRSASDGRLLVISAADPLNLAGVVGGNERVRAVATSRICYRNGVAIAALEGDYIRPLAGGEAAETAQVASALAGRRMPAIERGFVGRA